MKIFLVIVVLLSGASGYVYHLWNTAPSKFYQGTLNGKYDNKWYIVNDLDKKYFHPITKDYSDQVNIPNKNLWQNFHYGDLFIPLPVKNPFYFVVPNLKYDKKKKRTKFGLTILSSKDEVISHIYFLPNTKFPDIFGTQDFFDLPLVKKILKSKTDDQIWNDAFELDLNEVKDNWEQVSYYLYLLQFRMKILGSNFTSFGKLQGTDRMYIDIPYEDQDFSAELFLTKEGGAIHSFVIVSLKGNGQAEFIRKKMIDTIERENTSAALTDIIIKEFQSLKYREKIDHLGMFYLLSAWSHNQLRKSVLEQAIFHLERGNLNQMQLAPLYTYYFDRYKTVYSKKYVPGVKIDSALKLKLKVEAEKNQIKKVEERKPVEIIQPKKETMEGQFDKLIEKTKKRKGRRRRRRRKSIRID